MKEGNAKKTDAMSQVQKRVLAVVMLGTMMSAVDVTIVLLAIPDITKALHTNLAASIWIIIAYLLVVAVLTTQLGKVGDIYGRGKMFNLGFLVFTAASALCGASFNIYMLIGFRVLQGVGGSLMQANSGAIIADTFERHQRGKAFGFTSLGFNIGAMLGIVLGGVLTTFAGWPYIFYINVPIGLAAMYFGFKYIKTSSRRQEHLDLPGMAALAGALLLITLGVISMAVIGVSSYYILMILAGVAIIPVFIVIERRSHFPTINFGMLKNRILANSIGAAFMQSLGYLAIAFIIIMYLQGVRGLSPFDAALLLIPGYVLSGIAAPYMGRLSDRFGSRVIATIGMLLILSAVLFYYLVLTPTAPYYIIILATVMSGIGASMFYPSNSSAVMANASGDEYGAASGLLRTMSNIGTLGSFVIALTVAALAISRSVAFQIFLGTTDLTGHIDAAFVNGMHAVFIVSAGILMVGAILSVLRGKENRQTHAIQGA